MPDSFRRRLFQATTEVLGDPEATRRMGEQAIELNSGQSLKLALRALGSPRMLYANIVRANAKFNRAHTMDLLSLESEHARITNIPNEGTEYDPLGCPYNEGLLSCVPMLWGEPPARVSHPRCIGRGDEICEYDVRWTTPARRMRQIIAWGLAAVGVVGAAALTIPQALPFAVAAAVLVGVLWARAASARRTHLLETEVRQGREAADLLMDSLGDLVSALRLDEVMERITANARGSVGGAEFAILLTDPDVGIRGQGSIGLPHAMLTDLKEWAASSTHPFEAPVAIDDLGGADALASLRRHPELRAGSFLSFPLEGRDGPMGAFVAISDVKHGFFPHEIDLLGTYANQAAIAITNARLYEAQEALAIRDPLTGLFNHREFHERLSRELERCRRYGGQASIAMLDLDDFKLVNDTGGHAEGDHVLRGVAGALLDVCRTSDIAFRVGGDELALVLPETGLAEAEAVAVRVVERLGQVDRRVGVSIGVAAWPDHGPSKDTMIERADTELYADKHSTDPGDPEDAAPSTDVGRGRYAQSREASRLSAVRRLAARMSGIIDPVEIATTAVSEVQRAMDAPIVIVSKIHPDGIRLLAGAGPLWEELKDPASWCQELGEGVVGRAGRTGEPALIGDTRRVPEFLVADELPELRSELAVPIRVRGKVWGVLDVEHTEPGAFDVEDLEFADTMAAQVGAAIDRRLIFGDLEEKLVSTISVLREALDTSDVQVTLPLEEALAELTAESPLPG